MNKTERLAVDRVIAAVNGPAFQGTGCPRDYAILAAARQLADAHRVAQPMSLTDRASLTLTQLTWLFAAAIGWRPMV